MKFYYAFLATAAVVKAMEAGAAAGQEQFGECPCCFESITTATPSVFLDAYGRRARLNGVLCRHFACAKCVEGMIASGRSRACPCCRAPWATAKALPSITTRSFRNWFSPEFAEEWFDIVDADKSGSLSKQELLDALKVMVPVEHRKLEQQINERWPTWDADRSGSLSRQEIIDSVIPYVTGQLNGNGSSSSSSSTAPAPVPAPTPAPAVAEDIPSLDDPLEWFNYWDQDHSGSLSKEECVRAVFKTLESQITDAQGCADSMRVVFDTFDHDGNGEISFDEFFSGGFLQTILATMDADPRPPKRRRVEQSAVQRNPPQEQRPSQQQCIMM